MSFAFKFFINPPYPPFGKGGNLAAFLDAFFLRHYDCPDSLSLSLAAFHGHVAGIGVYRYLPAPYHVGALLDHGISGYDYGVFAFIVDGAVPHGPFVALRHPDVADGYKFLYLFIFTVIYLKFVATEKKIFLRHHVPFKGNHLALGIGLHGRGRDDHVAAGGG